MIRSNPTAIPLRASDLKHLQSELEKRKTASSGTAPIQQKQAGTSGNGTGVKIGTGAQAGPGSTEDVAAAGRSGRSVAERIGL